jgi:hypothetical protein
MIAWPELSENDVENDFAKIALRQDALDSPFWREHEKIFPHLTDSAFWQRERRFTQLKEATYKAKTFEKGWDGYYADSPSTNVVDMALEVLAELKRSALNPYSVLPSADGGIGISFRGRDNKRAVIELLNNGVSSYTLYGKGHTARRKKFELSTELTRVFQLLKEYL